MGRNPLQQPFLATSIWNMPIGANAVYVTSKINGTLTWPLPSSAGPFMDMTMADPSHLIRSPGSPSRQVKYSSVGWGGGDRCPWTAPETNLFSAPLPDNYIVLDSGGNESASIMEADGLHLIECQPLTRCTASGYATSIVHLDDADATILGHGRHHGSKGGSVLSAMGGVLRLGELRPGAPLGPRHALSILLPSNEVFYNAPTRPVSFRWPAWNSDSAWASYGNIYSNTNADVVMGTLFAIHKDANINTMGFETDPGLQLAWTFQNYGAYVVDTQNAGLGFCTEAGPTGPSSAGFLEQFIADYPALNEDGLSGNYNAFHQYWSVDSKWTRDLGRIYQNLWVIDNNGPNSIGGGGVPRVDYASLMEA